jgi:hypothetical protein
VTGPQIRTVFGRSKESIPETAPGRRILTTKDLPGKGIRYHPNHLRRLWQQGKFPEPFYPTKRRCAWLEETIDEWIDTKIAEAKQIASVPPHENENETVNAWAESNIGPLVHSTAELEISLSKKLFAEKAEEARKRAGRGGSEEGQRENCVGEPTRRGEADQVRPRRSARAPAR